MNSHFFSHGERFKYNFQSEYYSFDGFSTIKKRQLSNGMCLLWYCHWRDGLDCFSFHAKRLVRNNNTKSQSQCGEVSSGRRLVEKN